MNFLVKGLMKYELKVHLTMKYIFWNLKEVNSYFGKFLLSTFLISIFCKTLSTKNNKLNQLGKRERFAF